MSSERPSVGRLLAFTAPCLPLAAFGLPLVVYLPEHYSRELGLNLSMVGAAFMLVRLLDICFDPYFGVVLDRTRTRLGRFRPWLMAGTPLVMLAVYMLFMAKPGVGPLYLWVWLIVVYGGYSICVLAHTSWAAVLSPDYDQRSRVYAYWQTGNIVGMLLILLLPVILAPLGASMGVGAMGWFIIILLPIMVAVASKFVPEGPLPPPAAKGEGASIREYFRLFTRPAVLRILIADLLLGLAPSLTGSLFFFYFTRVKEYTRTESEILLLVYFVAAIASAPVWVRLANKFGKHKMLIAAALFYAAVQVLVVMLPVGNVWPAVPFLIAAGIPYSAAPFLLRAMMADVGDEERLNSGVDRTGLLYAILTGTVKVGAAMAVGISFIGLDLMGFRAQLSAETSAGGMMALQVLYAVIPAAMGILAALAVIGYPLTSARHAEIRAKLAERDAAPPPLTPEDVAVVEASPPIVAR